MEQRLSLVTLGVSDLDRARSFYEALGWKTGAAPDDDVVFFQAGGMIVALWDRDKLAEDSARRGRRRLGRDHPRLQHPLARGGRRRDRGGPAAGATIGREPGETFWGGYSAVFIDPDGYPWEVAHNPRWTIEEDGSVTLPSEG